MTVFALHRPLVPSPLNPDHKSTASSPQRAHRKIVISRRSANLSPTQRLLRRKASEAFNAHVITTSLAASPAPQPPRSSSPFQSHPQPLRRTAAATLNSRPKNALAHTSSARALLEEELAAMTEPLVSFDDSVDANAAASEDSYALKTRLVSSSAAADLLSSPLAALLHLLPLPLVSLFVLRFPSTKGSYNPAVTKKEKDVIVTEDTSFLQDAADLEECRAGELSNSVTASLPLVLTMRRLMAALGFLCLYALMQFEPLIRRPARSYA